MTFVVRDFPHKNIRLSAKNYHGKNRFFITVCCAERQRVFEDRCTGMWCVQRLTEIAVQQYFDVHAYCVMPDHLHLFLQGTQPACNLLQFMKTFKIKTSREFATEQHRELWQKKYYDHILRESESGEGVCWYIWMNPVRAGLVKEVKDYPFVGSLTREIPRVNNTLDLWEPPRRAEKRPPQKAAATQP
jgi:REP element-mobilizing transposase RayT